MGKAVLLRMAIALAVLATGCGGDDDRSGEAAGDLPPPAVQRKQLMSGDLTRTYRLFVPLSLDLTKPAPLVLVLGGVGNSAEGIVEATGFDRMADSAGIIVAYPDGTNQTWNAGYCCLNGAPTGPDDVAFLRSLIDDVQASHKIDPDRVFVVGVSAGGMMGYRLGCELADRIAGIGSVAGAMILDQCHPSRPVSVIEIHGTEDPLVPYQGGPTAGGATQPSPPTVAVVERWAELNRCPNPAATRTDGVVTSSTWTGCAGGTAVKLITIQGGGHTWYAHGLGPANGAVDATSEIWTFLSGLRRTS